MQWWLRTPSPLHPYIHWGQQEAKLGKTAIESPFRVCRFRVKGTEAQLLLQEIAVPI